MVMPSRIAKTGVLLATLLGASALSAPTQAADYLRGAYQGHQEPKTAGVDWAGVYGGVHGGYSSVKTGYRELGEAIGRGVLPNLAISDQIPPLISLGDVRKQGTSLGVFVGANYLWDDVVLGWEVDYTRSSVSTRTSAGPISRGLRAASTGTDVWDTTVSATARSEVKDWGTIRARAGWAAGWFMPYLTAGLALGNITSSATGSGFTEQFAVTADPVTGQPVYTSRGSTSNTYPIKHRGISYGGAIGAGVDMAFFSNFFLRAEWQYIQFASGGNRPELAINTGRVAGAVKF
jgi:outer membrane immunogenic protein